MVPYIKVPPMGYLEWLAWRKQGIGGSDAPTVMNKSPWSTPFELWAQKTDRIRPQRANAAMKRGRDMEPIAREEYEQMTGCAMPAACLELKKFRFIRTSCDGFNERAQRVLEIKCPGREDHLEARRGRIPRKYLWQCVHTLLVTGFDELDYFSFDGKRGVIVPFERDPKLEQKLLSEHIAFWRYVAQDVPPPKPELKGTPIDEFSVFRVRRSR
jgi:putative phage-type endonuclease